VGRGVPDAKSADGAADLVVESKRGRSLARPPLRTTLFASMNRRSFVAGLGFASVAGGCLTPRDSGSLRVLTYNTHHGEGVDGKLDLGRIAALVVDSGADVVAVQEVDVGTERTGRVDQSAEYRRLTGLEGRFGKAIDFQGGAYGQMLLSRWPIADFAVHRLPNPRGREQRIAVSARIRPPDRPAFRFVGVHLDATRDDSDRWLQVESLLSAFGSLEEPVVLAGDFNDTPESRVMRRALGRWSDASAGSPAPTVPVEKPVSRIDYVLFTPVPGWSVRSSRVLPEAVASDHRALRVEFGFGSASGA
jgi:endonuclease/exonuclease/phosphatase family metal-dependent hydrolase